MKRLYEAMFVVDHNDARTDFDGLKTHISSVVERFDGEVVQSVKWDERRLAYPIRHDGNIYNKGTYILVHFRSEPNGIIKMDRQFRLSERVIRHFIVRDEDGLLDEEEAQKREKAVNARAETPAPKPKEPAEETEKKVEPEAKDKPEVKDEAEKPDAKKRSEKKDKKEKEQPKEDSKEDKKDDSVEESGNDSDEHSEESSEETK